MANSFRLVLLLMGLSFKVHGQQLTLEDLGVLKDKDLSEFQENAYEKGFMFYQASSKHRGNADTVLFINADKMVLGLVARKDQVFITNISENQFIPYHQALKEAGYSLISTKVKANNVLEKKYLDKTKQEVVLVEIRASSVVGKGVQNTYALSLAKNFRLW